MFVFVCTAFKACSFPSESQPNTNENKLYVQPNSNNKNLVFNLVYTNTDFEFFFELASLFLYLALSHSECGELVENFTYLLPSLLK